MVIVQYWYELFRYKHYSETFTKFVLSTLFPVLMFLVIALTTSHIDAPKTLGAVVNNVPGHRACGLELNHPWVVGLSSLAMLVLMLNFHFINKSPWLIGQNAFRLGGAIGLSSAAIVGNPHYDTLIVTLSLIAVVVYALLYSRSPSTG